MNEKSVSGRNRTGSLLIRNQPLCLLSYGDKRKGDGAVPWI